MVSAVPCRRRVGDQEPGSWRGVRPSRHPHSSRTHKNILTNIHARSAASRCTRRTATCGQDKVAARPLSVQGRGKRCWVPGRPGSIIRFGGSRVYDEPIHRVLCSHCGSSSVFQIDPDRCGRVNAVSVTDTEGSTLRVISAQPGNPLRASK